MSMTGQVIKPESYLLMTISDELQMVIYQQRTAAGSKHNPKPKLMTERLKEVSKKREYESFDTSEDFKQQYAKIIKGG